MVDVTTAGIRGRRAFTIIEVLVVMLIMGILVALVIGLAGRVTSGGKYGASKNALQAFDSMATEFALFKGGQIPGWVRTNQTQANTGSPGDTNLPDALSNDVYIFPLVDGRYQDRVPPPSPGSGPGPAMFYRELDPAQPTAALFLLAASEAPEVKRAVERLDAKFMQRRDVWAYGWRVDPATDEPTGMPVRRRLRIAVPTDAFGFDLRLVHPEFQGGAGRYFAPNAAGEWTLDAGMRAGLQVRPFSEQAPVAIALFSRSFRPFNPYPPPPATISGNEVGDADEGASIASRVYFYSSGADGDAGTRSDNVYTLEPTFPAQTARLN